MNRRRIFDAFRPNHHRLLGPVRRPDSNVQTRLRSYCIVSENVSKGRSFRHSFSLRLMRLAFMNTSAYMDARWKDNSALSIGTYFLCFKSDLDRHLFDKMEGREVERVNYVIANQITACYPPNSALGARKFLKNTFINFSHVFALTCLTKDDSQPIFQKPTWLMSLAHPPSYEKLLFRSYFLFFLGIVVLLMTPCF